MVENTIAENTEIDMKLNPKQTQNAALNLSHTTDVCVKVCFIYNY